MNIIKTTGLDLVTVFLAPDAEARRAAVLKVAEDTPGVISTQEDADKVARALRELRAFELTLEADRKSFKQPIDKIGKDINTAAVTFITPVLTEKQSLQGRLNGWEELQLRRRQHAEAEARRKQKEAEEAQAAEAKRLADIAEAAAKKADTVGVTSTANPFAQIAARRAAEKATQAAQAAAVAPIKVEYQPPTTSRTVGVSVREDVDFEVTDLRKLWDLHPEVARLTEMRSEIRRLIKEGKITEGTPGIMLRKVVQGRVSGR